MEIDINLSQFHDIFFEESFEGIGAMESELLNLSPGTTDKDIINTIFRAAHSIKGSASTFGFGEISDFTHKLETVLDKMRNDELEITQELISALLSAVDSLNNMLISNKEGKPHDITIVENVSAQLEKFSSQATTVNTSVDLKPDSSDKQAERIDNNPEQRWRIGFFPNEKENCRTLESLLSRQKLIMYPALTISMYITATWAGVFSYKDTSHENKSKRCLHG